MPITIHCESCKRKITAPDGAGGKWGRCPHCNHRCYIPLPKGEDEQELTLSPVDESEETRYRQMMRETYNVTENVLHETEELPENGKPAQADKKQLTATIIKYLRQMADGQLEQAQQTAEKVVRYRQQTKKILEEMATAEMPEPKLQDVPIKVLSGFIRNMLTRLG